MLYDCIIAGAGASGLMCAAGFENKIKGLVIEKNKTPGRKLLMSGGGQCNITHAGSIKDFPACYGKNGGKIRSCLFRYSNSALIEMLEREGVPVLEREDGKIFPASMNSGDVLKMLVRKSGKNGFDLVFGKQVSAVRKEENIWYVRAGGDEYAGRTLVLATGGCSFPGTGSDGMLFRVMERDLDLEITELKPSLSSVKPENYPYAGLSGISFETAEISMGKIHNTGGLLLTHKDFSGPAVMDISKHMKQGDEFTVNYIAPERYENALERLKAVSFRSKASLARLIADEFNVPKRFADSLVRRYGEGLKALAGALTGEKFAVSSVSGFESAMATAGGVKIDMINPRTMESVMHSGLFIVGEALDIDGITGGYNLQFAFSSAMAAGCEIVKKLDG